MSKGKLGVAQTEVEQRDTPDVVVGETPEGLTGWIKDLDSADASRRAAAQRYICEVFTVHLIPQIRKKLDPRLRRRVSESDILQDVFLDFFKPRKSSNSELTDSRSLTALLMTIMLRNVINTRKREGRGKRDFNREVLLAGDDDSEVGSRPDVTRVRPTDPRKSTKRNGSSLPVAPSEERQDDSFFEDATIELLTYGATPGDAAVAIDTLKCLMNSIAEESDLPTVVHMKVKGHSDEEIAKAIKCPRRTVGRKLDLIRKRFHKVAAAD